MLNSRVMAASHFVIFVIHVIILLNIPKILGQLLTKMISLLSGFVIVAECEKKVRNRYLCRSVQIEC